MCLPTYQYILWSIYLYSKLDNHIYIHTYIQVQEGVLAVNTAAAAVASALSSIAQPAVWHAIQKVPLSGAMLPILQTAFANLAAMAPPVPTAATTSATAAGGSADGGSKTTSTTDSSTDDATSSSTTYPPPPEKDPYKKK